VPLEVGVRKTVGREDLGAASDRRWVMKAVENETEEN